MKFKKRYIIVLIFTIIVLAKASSSNTDKDGVTWNNVNYKILKVEKLDTARKGCEFVAVTVKITNNSVEKIPYNQLDWKMENSQGQEKGVALTSVNSKTRLHSGKLKSGESVTGTITFEQPIGDSGLKLNYYENILFDDEFTFQIKVK